MAPDNDHVFIKFVHYFILIDVIVLFSKTLYTLLLLLRKQPLFA